VCQLDSRSLLPDNHGMIRTIWAYVRLTHPWAVAVVMTATAVFGLIAAGSNPPGWRFLLLLTGMLGGQIAIGASNEWADRHADRLHKPARPIPSGLVTPHCALVFASAGLLLMTISGALLGWWELVLLAAGSAAGLVYNVWLKRTPWSWLPYLLALPLLPTWVWLVMDAFQPLLLWLYPLGAAFVLAIHLSQTLPDISADSDRGEHGLAVVVGRQRAAAIIWIAATGSTLAVAAGSLIAGGNSLPALLAAAVVAVILVPGWFAGERIDPHLFKVLTSCAVILSAGWTLTVTG
jgi:4-hydroxybenzoate polyprenyltransferase